MTETHAAGWLPDPLGRYQYRYWNGSDWTNDVSTNGSREVDPYGIAPTPARTPLPPPVTPAVASRPRLQWSTELQVLIFGGAAALVVGSLLPWVKAEAGIFSVTKNGIDGDGVFTLMLGAALALVFWLGRKPRASTWIVIALAGIATAIAAYDAVDVSNKAHDLASRDSAVSASVGIGLWITLIGGIAALLGGVLALSRGPRAS